LSFWDAIGDAFKSAGNWIRNAATDVYDFGKKVFASGALAVADGANLFSAGWKDVFSGDFQKGLTNIAFGMTEALGLVPPELVKQYEQVVGEASLWALRQSKTTNQQVCFTVYRDQVIANIAKLGLQWSGEMERRLRDGISQMPWINPAC